MPGGTFGSMKAMGAAFQRDINKLDAQLEKARRRAAQKTAAYVRKNVPVAFSTLRDSIREEGTKIIADAPHAMAVELGSRPHWAPLEPLIKWVQLRGFQSLVGAKSRARLPGTTTQAHANRIGEAFDASRRGGGSGPATQYTASDAAVKIAKGIQLSIAKKGTKPHFYMRSAIPVARAFLSVEIAAVFSKAKGTSK